MSASARTVVRLCGTGGSGSEHAQQQEKRRITVRPVVARKAVPDNDLGENGR
jgi:hypothetical protein